MDSEPRTRIRGIPAKTLSSYGYAVCFFPEQPRRVTVVEQDRATEEEIKKSIVKKVEASTKPVPKLLRLYWRNRLVYLVGFISYSLSLYNIYHFPMNVYRFGMNFFVPYTFVTIFVGYPLLVLEISMGQYSQQGAFWMWQCAPLFWGVGFGMILVCAFTCLYYNIFAAYALVYFSRCFSKILPWLFCDQTSCDKNEICTPYTWFISDNNSSSSSRDYFYDVILNTPQKYPSDSWSLGSTKWWLLISILFSWFLIYIATLRSARSIGKVAVVLVIFSYFAILSLLIAVFQLSKGYTEIRGENHTSLLSSQMWYAAIVQVLLELGLCFGIPITYGSFCRFRNLLHIDSIILCAFNYMNSLIFFFLFFAFVKSSSCNKSISVPKLPDDTVAVIFIIYSEAVTSMPASSYWCILCFLLLFCVLIGTQIAIAETVMTIIYDHFINLSKSRWSINLVICLIFFVFGVIFCCSNGFHGAILLYYLPIILTAIPLVFCFTVGIVLIYSLKQYSEDMNTMLQFSLNFIVKLLLYLLLIILLIAFIILVIFIYSPMLISGIFYYTPQAIFAWVVSAIILCPIIICGILWLIHCTSEKANVCRSSNSWKRSQVDRKQGTGQYTPDYSSSYIWPWN